MTVESLDNKNVRITLDSFDSPILLKNLGISKTILKEKIPDFRSMIDAVIIDPDYDGSVFHGSHADVPPKNALVKGVYEVSVPRGHSTIGVKILAVTGEETVLVQKI